MAAQTKIIGLGGSLALNSRSLAALKVALEAAQEAGAEVELFDIRSLDLPMFVPGTSDIPPAAIRMCEAACEAAGLIWSSPLYHGTISGSFKNALDWFSILADRSPPYLSDKVIGLISTAGGVHGLQAVNTMEFAVRSLRGWAVPLVLPIPRAWQVFAEDGTLRDPSVAEQLRTLGREVLRAARQFEQSGDCDYEAARG